MPVSRIKPWVVVLVAALAGVALFGAPAVGQLSDERRAIVHEGDPICTPAEDAVGEHSMVCVLGTQETRDPIPATGTDVSLVLAALGLLGLGIILIRVSPRPGVATRRRTSGG